MLPVTVASLLVLFTDPVASQTTLPEPVEESGSLTGQFVYDGNLPEPQFHSLKKDTTICGTRLAHEDLIIDPETRGIRYVAVFMRKPKWLPPKPQLSPDKSVIVRLDGCRFSPRLIVARVGQRIEVRWKNTIIHSVFPQPIRSPLNGRIIAPGKSDGSEVFENFRLRTAEPVPIPVRCAVHPHEKGYWLILDHPYFAVTSSKGLFRIDNLPTGEHEFRTWHERTGWIQKSLKVKIDARRTTDLGKIEVNAKRFSKTPVRDNSTNPSRR